LRQVDPCYLRIEGTVPGFEELDAFAREAAPTVARGNNVVAVTPPSPSYAAPLLAALAGRITGGQGGLLLAPAAEVESWGALLHGLALDPGLEVLVARGEARATRRLREGGLPLLIASPETALALLRRSALKPETLAAVVLAWPERLEDGDTLAQLMHDLPRDAQRIVVTALADRAADLVERYARKAITIAVPAPAAPETAPAGTVRTAAVAWERRAGALGEIVELLDPSSTVVWAADQGYADAIARALPLGTPAVQLVHGDAPAADLIIAFDLPTAGRLAQLRQAGSVVLLVPPGTEQYAARLAPGQRPLRLPGALEVATREAATRRSIIADAIGTGDHAAALLALAPLFERHDATAVAAALYTLWTAKGAPAAPALPDAAPAGPSPAAGAARVWVGIGKKDGVSPNDFVGLMTKELRVAREAIGRIDLRDSFSLIEVPGGEAEAIARALTGATVRKKRLVAHVDRGTSGGGKARPGAPRGGPRR
jgi:ATP-dependent RNA helicase DeaD